MKKGGQVKFKTLQPLLIIGAAGESRTSIAGDLGLNRQ
jgi:hypothetical protein